MPSKLKKLIIKNFRAIGNNPIEIDLNEIVVLVGPNNVGKSSILQAYEVLMLDGPLEIDDFHGKDLNNHPEMILYTEVSGDNLPSEKWREKIAEDLWIVKERFVWDKPKSKSQRNGFIVAEGRWSNDKDDEKVPWGAKNVAQINRPYPHRIDAFANPEYQAQAIINLFDEVIQEKLKLKQSEEGEESNFTQLVNKIKELQEQVLTDGKEEIEKIESDLSAEISKVFPSYKINFNPNHEEDLSKSISFFNGSSELRMGPENGFQSSISNQGSGARRTLLLTALKSLVDIGKKADVQKTKTKVVDLDTSRQQLLLMDEPEICLHPLAVREMSKTLYELPVGNKWQVMLTTHSPQFVDFSRDNTTIVRVYLNENNSNIESTTLYRPERVSFDEDDKENLKLLNMLDPYVAEFFFGGKTILVEGDTEYTAFNYLKSLYPDKFSDAHIVRARGKATLVSLIKILNHFGSDYSILHDADTPKRKDGSGNSAWTANSKILQEVSKKPSEIKVRLVASIKNFEEAYLKHDYKDSKPYNAFENMSKQADSLNEVEKLLLALLNHNEPLPEGAIEWNDIDQLEKEVLLNLD